MKNLTKHTKSLTALAFTFLLLAGGYRTALAQQADGAAKPDGSDMQAMMQDCPMMKDSAKVKQMMENCPMMKGMMQGGMMNHGSMMQKNGQEGEHASPTGQAAEGAATGDFTALEGAREAGMDVRTVKVTVGPKGFEPTRVELKAGVPARLIFTRTTDATCATQIQAPDFGIKKTDLPLNKPITLSFTPEKGGTFSFACGMGMLKGAIVVKSW